MSEIWSVKNIKADSAQTPRKNFDELEEKLAGKKKLRFYPLGKAKTELEVLGLNPRIIAHEIETKPASIWYGLYDGSLLEALKDESKKNTIQRLLKTYFHTDTLPVIPIYKPAPDKDPKFKLKGKTTRIYSLFGGANLRTLFSIGIHEFHFDSELPLFLDRVANALEKKGYQITLPNQSESDLLVRTEANLIFVEDLKAQLKNKPSGENGSEKKMILMLELFVKFNAIIHFFDSMGITHIHPHGGNCVTSWSKKQLSQTKLEKELVNPTQLSTDYDVLATQYPNCTVYPFMIDFDQIMFIASKIKDTYDKEKLLALLSSPNEMHQIMAHQLLPALTDQ